jgi:hypothetical protein
MICGCFPYLATISYLACEVFNFEPREITVIGIASRQILAIRTIRSSLSSRRPAGNESKTVIKQMPEPRPANAYSSLDSISK